MHIKLRTLLLALPLFAGACSAPDTGAEPAARTIRVTVGSAPGIDIGMQAHTRTDIGPDGETIRWNGEDTIALWAVNPANPAEAAFAAHPFAMYHYNAVFNEAKFTADIPAMAEGTYAYYAVSPRPDAVAGTLASFDIPAVQEFATAGGGDFATLPYDVMIADPVQGPALEEGDNSDRVNLSFHHKVHLLKVVVQSNNLAEKVSEVELTFPQPVVGRLTVDAANPDADPVLTEGSETLTLRFDRPVEQGTTVYAAIAPIDLTGEEFSIVAYGETGASQVRALPGKAFAAGHTTPIIYNIPVMGRLFTRVKFTLAETGEATLGEKVGTVALTDADGFPLGSFPVNETGEYFLTFREFPDNVSGKSIKAGFDSQNAYVEQTVNIPVLTDGAVSEPVALRVPCLMEEDFSSISQTAADYDNPPVGGTTIANGDGTGIDLSQWGLSTRGWTAARVGVQSGGNSDGAVRICARVENQTFAKNIYKARIDSAPFTGIKPGKEVNVRVSYNYKGGRWSIERTFTGGNKGPGNGDAIYSCGYTTREGWQAGSTDIPNVVKNDVTIPGTAGNDRNQNQNYDDIVHEDRFDIPAAGNTTRASWMVSSTTTTAPFSGFNGNYWLYLDNVKVSIIR